jgi:hypothetical protein
MKLSITRNRLISLARFCPLELQWLPASLLLLFLNPYPEATVEALPHQCLLQCPPDSVFIVELIFNFDPLIFSEQLLIAETIGITGI